MSAVRTFVSPWLLVIAIAVSACSFLPGPQVTCDESVTAEDCDRAVDIARPLLAAYWDQAREALVHPGVCTLEMECSDRQATFPGYITVELVSDQPESASVTIDQRDTEWTATRRLIVPDENGAWRALRRALGPLIHPMAPPAAPRSLAAACRGGRSAAPV